MENDDIFFFVVPGAMIYDAYIMMHVMVGPGWYKGFQAKLIARSLAGGSSGVSRRTRLLQESRLLNCDVGLLKTPGGN